MLIRNTAKCWFGTWLDGWQFNGNSINQRKPATHTFAVLCNGKYADRPRRQVICQILNGDRIHGEEQNKKWVMSNWVSRELLIPLLWWRYPEFVSSLPGPHPYTTSLIRRVFLKTKSQHWKSWSLIWEHLFKSTVLQNTILCSYITWNLSSSVIVIYKTN